MQPPSPFAEMPSDKLPPTNTKLLLSLSTVPMLLLLIGAKFLAELMQETGRATEEVFRGDRLPVLKVFDFTVFDAGDDNTPE